MNRGSGTPHTGAWKGSANERHRNGTGQFTVLDGGTTILDEKDGTDIFTALADQSDGLAELSNTSGDSEKAARAFEAAIAEFASALEIDPSHIVFAFDGEGIYGVSISEDADTYRDFSGTA